MLSEVFSSLNTSNIAYWGTTGLLDNDDDSEIWKMTVSVKISFQPTRFVKFSTFGFLMYSGIGC